MHRIFIGLEIKKLLAKKLQNLCPQGKQIVSQPDLHLTLHFVGEVNTVKLQDLKKILMKIHFTPFNLTLNKVDSFDKGRTPHFLIINAEKSQELNSLRQKIGECLLSLDFKLEDKSFVPHVTISKLNEKSEDLVNKFKETNSLFLASSVISEFSLYEVDNSNKNPRYKILQSYKAYI